MPPCPFPRSVVAEAWTGGFVLPFHFVLKVCLCFVWALPFLPFIRWVCFLGIFLPENSHCVWSYSRELPYLVLARKFARGGYIFNQANWYRCKTLPWVWKEMPVFNLRTSWEEMLWVLLDTLISYMVTCWDKTGTPEVPQERSFQREIESTYL